jgi:tetrahydromethanopterin S-methyltransferase subunit B
MTPIDYNNPNEMWRHNGYDPYRGMSDDERMKAGCMQVVAFIVMLIVGLAICALFGSCTTTKYVEVEKVRTDTTYITQHQRDSIYVHDSTFIREKGDTFYMERWHTKYVVNEKHDTTYVATHDTIPQPYPVTEYVEKPLSKIEKGLIGVGILTLMALVIFVAMKIKRFLP